ncbi:MAG: type IV secretory system conjugative DNA transfer family protein [Solirubrobacteraceae bacterium]
MTNPGPTSQWGPAPAPKSQRSRWLSLALLFGLLLLGDRPWVIAAAVLALIALVVVRRRSRRQGARQTGGAGPSIAPAASMTLEQARDRVEAAGAGAFLGLAEHGAWRLSRAQRAVLVLGPPRSGKSAGLIIPTVLSYPGPVVCTSTKPDVLAATAAIRGRTGRVWELDPTGQTASSPRSLRWSPVSCARSWDGAMMIARAMVTGAGVGTGTTDQTHWSRRAQALLAPMLHAAALAGLGIGEVADWVARHELDRPGGILAEHDARLAANAITGLLNTEARERSSIFSAAADALEAYSSQGALAAASDPNFDAAAFVRSNDTVYVHAPAEHQAMAAPLVCGLLAEIRRATYAAHARGQLERSVLFALDEAANIAPLAELPQIASEGGGQGLSLIAAFQDLSQARHRWGQLADGFLTLFGEKLILPGVADPKTIEAISLALGEYDRTVTSNTSNPGGSGGGLFGAATSKTTTIVRQRVLSPGEIANIPAGRALHLDGLSWELLSLVNAHRDAPWTRAAAAAIQPVAAAAVGSAP